MLSIYIIYIYIIYIYINYIYIILIICVYIYYLYIYYTFDMCIYIYILQYISTSSATWGQVREPKQTSKKGTLTADHPPPLLQWCRRIACHVQLPAGQWADG